MLGHAAVVHEYRRCLSETCNPSTNSFMCLSHSSSAAYFTSACCMLHATGLICLQIFVMGPIVVLVRRPSLRIPVAPEDVTHDMGAIQAIARISSFASEFSSDVTLKGDPPQWVVQARPLQALLVSRRFHKQEGVHWKRFTSLFHRCAYLLMVNVLQ